MKKHSDSKRQSTKLTKVNRKNRSKDNNCSFSDNYTKSEKTNVDIIKSISNESRESTVNRTTTTEDKTILTSTLIKALRTLNGENGTKNNAILKKLLDANETQNGYPGLLTGKPQASTTNTVGKNEEMEDDEELVEYVFNPRRYFIYSACELCKSELKQQVLSCKKCNMTHYCSLDHMEQDDTHVKLCAALQQIKSGRGEQHIYANLAKLSPEDYRVYRVITMKKCEEILDRPLQHFEREIVIYPRICYHCKEWRNDHLLDCSICGQVYCKDIPENIRLLHKQNCQKFALLRKLIIKQEKEGNIQPCLPQNILSIAPNCASTMEDILKKLGAEVEDECNYAALTQVASAPLTVWYGLKLAQALERPKLNIHLIGAEMQFEGDLMQKWELILHLAPFIKNLEITFVGPELVPPNISMQPIIKSKVCNNCHQNKRVINLYFVESMYHDYCASSSYSIPDLICFLNPGLHRITGFNNIDSWPATIQAASKQNKPVIITSYTAYECPLDLHAFLKESNRPVNMILPPMTNPFTSHRPERNFISDEKTPLMFKNFYSFMVE